MYGLVNRALQQLVCSQRGEQVWNEIRARAGVDYEVFTRMDSYPDEVTHSLVAAAAEVLATPTDVLLREFGRYWMRYTMVEGYGALLSDLGKTLQEAFAALDAMHARVALLYPELKPPTFKVVSIEPGCFHLHYSSHRSGFVPMVAGLIEGMGERYGMKLDVRHLHPRSEFLEHDVFEIRVTGPLPHDD